ncbi:MAG: YggU family protein [Deltaproteobacteria bacterium]|nr:YggU family protein [Deltaproteobacteria bacterium]
MSDSPARWDGPDLVLTLHAQPGARRTEVHGLHDGALKLRLAARAIEGAANAALVEFLSETFRVPKRQVTLESGETSRHKRVRVRAPDAALSLMILQSWGV